LASGKETSVNYLVKKMIQMMDVKDHPVHHVEPRPGDVRRHCGGISLANQLIGFKPQIELEEGLRETIHWYLNKER
jgi:UDP-glucose 4-epimerase